MKRSTLTSLLVTGSALAAQAGATPPPPNIVVILVDDLGYADLGVQGSKDVVSPRIDSIAKNGIRFTDGYVTASQCSPSRAGLLTGRNQPRFGYDVNLGLDLTMKRKLGLPFDEPTLAELLKPAGYTSGVIGKWDLGSGDDYHPNARGFDYFYGFVGGSRPHRPSTGQPFFNKMLRNRDEVEETDWSSDIYGKESADFIRRERKGPFFLYASFTAPHWPMEAREEDLARFTHVEDLHRRTFLAMMAGLDRGVGMVLDAIKETGIEDRTLVFFLSDNGGPTGLKRPRTSPDAPFAKGVNTSRNDPLRGEKGQIYDGGIRIPFFAMWPGTIPAGQISDVPITSLDIAATTLALAGAKPGSGKPLDGINLMPILTGNENELPVRNLFWRIKNLYAIRNGNWKYLQIGNHPPELYNLTEDIGEKNNLIEPEAGRSEQLCRDLNAWLETLPPPAW